METELVILQKKYIRAKAEITKLRKHVSIRDTQLLKLEKIRDNFEEQLEIQLALKSQEMNKKYQELVEKTLNISEVEK